ncbi:FecR domain-containing protein [Alloalcanivorax marinus]|uniref:FecR domain-containing protein n=1 Tax=Alloalcanivorax marinus TaxID=1177169 RepID=UPI0019328862|nr:FecR family protein [Alloalcanivorax marinus]MBL7250820.1 FecR family protein [Alloalcanivorax marinus]
MSDSDSVHVGPMAEGQPLDEAVASQAAEWLTLLMSDQVDEADRRRWRHWRRAHPDHDRAWRHIEAVTGRFQEMVPGAAYRALSSEDKGPSSPGRRKVLGALLMVGAGGALGAYSGSWRRWSATYATRIGERQAWTLADGTRVTLNTGSALDVDFSAGQRRLRLLAGEVWVVTTHAVGGEDPRPLTVDTVQGRFRSLGTRFSVRQEQGRTRLVVSESAVAARSWSPAEAPRVVRAGQTAVFSDAGLETLETVAPAEPGWVRGQIVADDMPLDEFLDELKRYRPGLLRHDDSLAGLRVSGVFPLDDTDRILETLPRVIPVSVNWRTRYWVTVTRAP